PDYDHHLVEAMWACQNVERPSEKILNLVLNASDGHARSAGARIIRYWHNELSDPVAMVAKACGDPFPRARMEAVLSAEFIPKAQAYAAALNSVDHANDSFLELALPQTRQALEKYWRPALEGGTLRFHKEAHRDFAEQEAGIGFEKRLADFIKQDSPSEKDIAGVCEQLRAVGSEQDLQQVAAALSEKGGVMSSEATLALLETLKGMAGSHRSKSLSRRMQGLKKFLDSENEAVAILAAENLGVWGVPRAAGALNDLVSDVDRKPALRRSAAVAFARLGGKDGIESLVVLSREGDPETRYAALSGLVSADLNQGVPLAAQLLADDPGQTDPVPLVRRIIRQRNGGKLLANALRDVEIHHTIMAGVSDFHRASGLLPKELVPMFQPSSDSDSLSVLLLREDQNKLSADVEALGDAARGEMVYRRKALSCVNCHAIGPAGSLIGPNLVAAGAAAKTGYIVESILQPDKAIAEHYENRLFLLDDGTIQRGIVTFKSEKEIVVRDAALAGKEVRLPLDEIVAEKAQPSAMPTGLVDQLAGRQEFLDLAKFVSVLGKPGAYANDESPVIRKWRIVAMPTDELPNQDATWIAAYSKVSGELPSVEFPTGDHVFAQGHLIVQVAGTAELSLNSHAGLRIWMDGNELPNPPSVIDLADGRRTLTFAIDRDQRGDVGLKVEVAPTPGSSAKLKPEGGI
ncbi:MAG: HEAT repeat domain-containing protein, partial [Rubripirellula sp.]